MHTVLKGNIQYDLNVQCDLIKYEILLKYRKSLYCKGKINSLLKSYKICILNIIDSFDGTLNEIELLSYKDKLLATKKYPV